MPKESKKPSPKPRPPKKPPPDVPPLPKPTELQPATKARTGDSGAKTDE